VAPRTGPLPLITREIVATETPAIDATWRIEGLLFTPALTSRAAMERLD
jgi:hypothetical protein